MQHVSTANTYCSNRLNLNLNPIQSLDISMEVFVHVFMCIYKYIAVTSYELSIHVYTQTAYYAYRILTLSPP